ncbi:hypothetical protein F2Q68_00031365 [Brassica cretica]|uniref:Uncharacterized protein n=1 Tax=Brassica cretica TaxID=69181 RepID=A0A8S9G898_BRACR|nr:hypothetical protein F2Q68_00031365 [Brassica cretica]
MASPRWVTVVTTAFQIRSSATLNCPPHNISLDLVSNTVARVRASSSQKTGFSYALV